jgi:hypothetical protein
MMSEVLPLRPRTLPQEPPAAAETTIQFNVGLSEPLPNGDKCALTDAVRALGCRGGAGTPFDVLPLVIQLPDKPPRLIVEPPPWEFRSDATQEETMTTPLIIPRTMPGSRCEHDLQERFVATESGPGSEIVHLASSRGRPRPRPRSATGPPWVCSLVAQARATPGIRRRVPPSFFAELLGAGMGVGQALPPDRPGTSGGRAWPTGGVPSST